MSEKFLKKDPKDFCEGCSDLGIYDTILDGCNVCKGPKLNLIAQNKFGQDPNLNFDSRIGYYHKCIEATSKMYNEKSSAGGLATSLLMFLLESKAVDYILSVSFDKGTQRFIYSKFQSTSDLVKQQRSAYFPVNLSSAFNIINQSEGTCAITGIPTAIKAIELKKNSDTEFNRKVKYTIGLVSGGIKIESYTDYLCRKSGKSDGLIDIEYLSYRDKPESGHYWGNNYFFKAKTSNTTYQLKSDKLKLNWPSGLLKSFASDFCDDTFNITSDITIMDGWLPKYKNTRGVSLAIIRDLSLSNSLEENFDLVFKVIDKEDIVKSQIGGFRHKTDGLKARVLLFKYFGNKVPENLEIVDKPVSIIIFLEQLLRLRSSYISRVSYAKTNSYKYLDKKLQIYIFLLRVVNKIKHTLLKN